MPGIFISHASADEGLVTAFVDNVIRLGCGVPAQSIFYSSGADTGVPSGADLNTYVREKVGDAGLVVAIITPTFLKSSYCIAELGAAWARLGNLFPLVAPGVDRDMLDGVLAGMFARPLYDGAALDELYERVRELAGVIGDARTWGKHRALWLESAPALLAQHIDTSSAKTVDGRLRWGQLFDGVVDAAIYTANDFAAREDIQRAARAGTLVPGRYLYSSDSGASNWIALCDEAGYRHQRETLDFWAGTGGRAIADHVRHALGRNDFDYVSLGCGNGQKDADLIAYWLDTGADVFYYPYDVSLPLVARAIRTVRRLASPTGERLHVKAVLADFNHLTTVSAVFKHRSTPNVVALLGNSLGNVPRELGFLHDLHRTMSNEDVLILEVRLQSRDRQLPEYAPEQALRFHFGPLEYYFGVPYRREKMIIDHSASMMSSIPGTITTVVGCEDIELGGEHFDRINLIYIHEYQQQPFLTALSQAGFDVIESGLGGADGGFLVCVVRRRGQPGTPTIG